MVLVGGRGGREEKRKVGQRKGEEEVKVSQKRENGREKSIENGKKSRGMTERGEKWVWE